MKKIALVTGANQGLGLALVRLLSRQWGEQGIVYLGARQRERGEEAVVLLQAEGLSPQLAVIDVADDASVQSCADLIRQRHGGIDVLISNAAARISPAIPSAEQVGEFVNTNNHGTVRMLRAFAPLLNKGSRLLVVASDFGRLSNLPVHLHHLFDETTRSLSDIENVMDTYARAVQTGTAQQEGWPEWINIPSKIGQVAALRVLAREMHEQARQRDILLDAVCPGLVDTAASRPWFNNMTEAQSPDQAAEDIIWLATLPKGTSAPYGELVQHKRVLPFR
ncbi:SDR family NAD(P)-dependent oxidoreductase [Ktedonosporobacter rubrisoli]|uniref:SDR family NAD(P)-dependent oxidoreductase n=1 Tax=Ktedonosporobacter rubrisoli TaxID=2509675 RepID=A0A4P6K0M7_KTERU|nr:SDR family NAD(P)-dependent oxidoreductase [Ktedonosporobacter rubrisoli]QBD81180.1 SDR family NAD(P)-dependent oxidoreductase [Ktedonosporobacter rubrisoli]